MEAEVEQGSGKSVFCQQKIVIRILMDYNAGFRHRFLALRKTAPYARKSIFREFVDIIHAWGLSDICVINKTQMVCTFSNGSTIECMGLDDPEKVKSIAGITGVFMEEITEFTPDDFKQLSIRMRGEIPSYFQIMGAFNPVSKLNWVYPMFFEEPLRLNSNELTTHFSTYKDNKFAGEQFIKKMEAFEKIDYNYYRIYTLAEWGSLENLIYKDNWKIVPGFPDDVEEVCMGLDFGYNHPTALVLTGYAKEGIYVKELIYRSKLTISRLVDVMKRAIPNDPTSQYNRQTKIYCDNARPEAITQIREAGFNAVKVAKGKNSVKEGIDLVKQNPLLITKDSFNVIAEISKYKWREDKNGIVFEEPFKHDDDAMDALRYSIFMNLRRNSSLNVFFMDM